MTEGSMPWDGTTTGHAGVGQKFPAAYDSTEWAYMNDKIFGSGAAKGYVLPGYANNLAVSANNPAAMNVLVATGAVHLKGKFYEIDAQTTLTIDAADATNPRIDRIVLRITYASQTVEAKVVTGTPAATPSLPGLTQNSSVYEIPLAYVWVAAATASIAATEVHDERTFANNFESGITKSWGNLIRNSEFMAWSRLPSSAGAPDLWGSTGTISAYASATKPTQMSRGRAAQFTTGAVNSGISQSVFVRPSTPYSIKVLLFVTGGDIGEITVTDGTTTLTKRVRRTGAFVEEIFHLTTAAAATGIGVTILGVGSGDVIRVGQVLVVEGYVPGPYREVPEIIFFTTSITDPDVAADTFAAATDVTINVLSTDYQSLLLSGTRAVLMRLVAKTTDASASNYIALQNTGVVDYGRLEIGGGLNDVDYSAEFWIPDTGFKIHVEPAAAATVTLTAYIKGIQT